MYIFLYVICSVECSEYLTKKIASSKPVYVQTQLQAQDGGISLDSICLCNLNNFMV